MSSRTKCIGMALVLSFLVFVARTSAQVSADATETAKPRSEPVLTPQQIEDILADIRARSRGQVFVVDRHASYGYRKIQSAIDAASDGDVIVVLPYDYDSAERYRESINFLGKAITVQSAQPTNPLVVAATVIDAEADDCVVMFRNYESADSVLDGLTLTNGWYTRGGGVSCRFASPTVRNCIITANAVFENGGGVECYGASDPTFTNCHIVDNSSSNGAGGVFCYQSSPIFTDCVIENNQAVQQGGGGILLQSDATFVDCTFNSNSSPTVFAGDGGGLLCIEDTATLIRCTFRNNMAGVYGGGLYCRRSSDLIVDNCVFAGNSALWNGGGVYCYASSLLMTNSTIIGNTANDSAAAVLCATSDLTMINCTVSRNSCQDDGAIGGDSSNITLFNCILWENTPRDIYAYDPAFCDFSYCNIADGIEGEGNINTDPLFVDPDGLDDTLGTEDDDFRLRPMSPCINTGDPDFIAAPDATDLDGLPRVMGCGVDMGAYEFSSGAAGSGDFDGNGAVDYDDMTIFIAALLDDSGPLADCVADLNSDGHLDGDDIQWFKAALLTAQ